MIREISLIDSALQYMVVSEHKNFRKASMFNRPQVGEYEARFAGLLGRTPDELFRTFKRYRESRLDHGDYERSQWDDDDCLPIRNLIQAVHAYQSSKRYWSKINWREIASMFPNTLGRITRSTSSRNILKDKWNHIAEVTRIKSWGISCRVRSRSPREIPSRLNWTDKGLGFRVHYRLPLPTIGIQI